MRRLDPLLGDAEHPDTSTQFSTQPANRRMPPKREPRFDNQPRVDGHLGWPEAFARVKRRRRHAGGSEPVSLACAAQSTLMHGFGKLLVAWLQIPAPRSISRKISPSSSQTCSRRSSRARSKRSASLATSLTLAYCPRRTRSSANGRKSSGSSIESGLPAMLVTQHPDEESASSHRRRPSGSPRARSSFDSAVASRCAWGPNPACPGLGSKWVWFPRCNSCQRKGR